MIAPPGSACSIAIGTGISDGMQPGSIKGLHLIVTDIEVAQAALTNKWVQVNGPVHFVNGEQVAGAHPQRGDYETFLYFSDPDGNGWMVQEVGRGARGS